MISLPALFASGIWRNHTLGIVLCLGLAFLFSQVRNSSLAQTPARKLTGGVLILTCLAAAIGLSANLYRLTGMPGVIAAFLTATFLSGCVLVVFPRMNVIGDESPGEAFRAIHTGLLEEMRGNWNESLNWFARAGKSALLENNPWAAGLAEIYSARIMRGQGQYHQANQSLAQVMREIEPLPEDNRKRYITAEAQMVAGTVHQKLPLPADKQAAKDCFEMAIRSNQAILESLEIDNAGLKSLLTTNQTMTDSVFSNLVRDVILMNMHIGQINLAEMLLHEGPDGWQKADEIANQILANQSIQDGKLTGGALRIKGEIALQKQEWGAALPWFQQAYQAYSTSATAARAETLAAVQNRIQEISFHLGREAWVGNGSVEAYPELEKVPEEQVYRDMPFLRDLDARASSMPASESWRLYLQAAERWDDAGWRDRLYEYLVKATACLDTLRENIPLKGAYLSERRAEFYGQSAQRPLMALVELLLSPEAKKIPALDFPVAEAFYYREKLGALGFLDELEASHALSELIQSAQTNELEIRQLFKGEACRVEEVQAHLSPDTFLVEYVLTEQLLAAFVITKSQVMVPLYHQLQAGTSQAIQNQIIEFIQSIGDRVSQSGQLSRTGFPQVADIGIVKNQGQALYELLIAPLNLPWLPERLLKVVFVPQGILHSLPFSALYDGDQFLAEKAIISQMPGASLVRQHREKSSPLLYFGLANPLAEEKMAFETVVAQAAKAFGFDGDWAADFLSEPGQPVLGLRRQKASLSNIKKYIGQYRIVDFQTHGTFDRIDPMNSGFIVLDENGEPINLSAKDVFLHVRMEADLLVAAMCSSGQVTLRAGDEMVGLLRAFLFAGCQSILMYPWLLLDEGASLFLGEFYRQLAQSMPDDFPKEQALQQAQIAVIQRGRRGEVPLRFQGADLTWEHPRFWAWTLITNSPEMAPAADA